MLCMSMFMLAAPTSGSEGPRNCTTVPCTPSLGVHPVGGFIENLFSLSVYAFTEAKVREVEIIAIVKITKINSFFFKILAPYVFFLLFFVY